MTEEGSDIRRINPVTTEPYTADEISAICDGAAERAEGYIFDAPVSAMIGVSLYDSNVIFWYDAEAAEAIIAHADPLILDAESGALFTAEGELVANAMQ